MNKFLDKLTLFILAIGGINWGLVALAKFNIVETLLGTQTLGSNIVYAVVGLSGLYGLVRVFRPTYY